MKMHRYVFLFLSIFSLSAMSDEFDPFDDNGSCSDFESAFNQLDRGRAGASSVSAPDVILAEPTINEEALLVPTAMPALPEQVSTVYGAEDDALSSRPDRRKKGRFPCNVCGCPYPAASERERLSHERMHAIEHLTCECGYLADCQFKMQRHNLIHTGGKPSMCSYPGCGKRFAQYSTLKIHERTHTGEKSYVCSYPGCGKRFADHSTLKNHELTHSGEKPHMCSYPGCGKRFAQRSHLTYHARIHTGEKPHMCSYPDCGKRFISKSDLKKHNRIHTGEKLYVCPYPGCDQSFTRQLILTRHKDTHSGARPHVCSICNSCFVRKGHLATHLCTKKHAEAAAAAIACAFVLSPQQPVAQEVSEPAVGGFDDSFE